MSSFFSSSSSNPLQTEIGQIIEKSFSPYEREPTLELYFEICDLINLKEENAKDAFKAIRKELNIYKGKNWSVVNNILILLETCSNNCNKKFHIHLSNKDFLNELKTMIGPKLQPPLETQEKVLYLIQLWKNMFHNDPEFKNIEAFYTELRSKGVDFPINNTSFDKLIEPSIQRFNQNLRISNEQSNPSGTSILTTTNTRHTQDLPSHQYTSPRRPVGILKLNDEQTAKLNSELNVVESNVQVFNEILTELQSRSNKLHSDEDQDVVLLKELDKTCKEMQKRITQLIGNISNESIINELLRINDDLNNVFLRYERFERTNKLGNNSKNDANNSESQIKIEKSKQASEEKPLIDFTDLNDVQPKKNEQVKEKSADSLSFFEDENEIKEMENWLKSQEMLEKK